jgi:hypothetical protein
MTTNVVQEEVVEELLRLVSGSSKSELIAELLSVIYFDITTIFNTGTNWLAALRIIRISNQRFISCHLIR